MKTVSLGLIHLTAARLESRTLAVRLLSIFGFVGLIAVGAYLKFFLPGNPVPVTLQTAFVLLAGALLGPVDAVAAVLAYIALGVFGVPLFAGASGAAGLAYLSGVTGGYLVGFIVAAALTGIAARRLHSFWSLSAAFMAATLLILAFGVAWLALGLARPLSSVVIPGGLVFVPGGILKSLFACILYRRLARKGSTPPSQQ